MGRMARRERENRRMIMKAKPQNIECFEIVAGALLGHLYESFPKPVQITCVDFQRGLLEDRVLPDHCVWEDAKGQPGLSLVATTMDFLRAEGYVRADCKPTSLRLNGCILTARGFQALNTRLDLGQETIGTKLSNLRKATDFTAAEMVRSLFALGTQLATTQLSGQT